MTLKKYSDGNVLYANELNNSFAESYNISALNLIRTLQNRSVNFSEGNIDWFGDAYVDSNGQMNSVNTDTTAVYNSSDKTYEFRKYDTGSVSGSTESDSASSSDDTRQNSISYTVTLAYDGIFTGIAITGDTSLATISIKSTDETITYASKTITPDSNGEQCSFSLSDYSAENGESSIPLFAGNYKICITGTNIVIGNNKSYSGTNFSYSNISIAEGWTYPQLVFQKYTDTTVYTYNVISHDIPSGTFSSTVDTLYSQVVINSWEEGDSIKVKLTNATEDSGWLDINSVESFTAFTSEPTKYLIQLNPKSSSPTSGYPSILGSAIRGA